MGKEVRKDESVGKEVRKEESVETEMMKDLKKIDLFFYIYSVNPFRVDGLYLARCILMQKCCNFYF